ncbi:MAG: hypothetical protein KGM15_13045 [Pseudomonadota bacterium]|nr:hypothetical protein [Pseudomonadota bacterium]
MRRVADIESELEAAPADARRFVALAEETLELWLAAHGAEPTCGTSEGSRLLALHRQGARGDPSFNACRETCRELVYRQNLVAAAGEAGAPRDTGEQMRALALHLAYFIGGKLENAKLGEFCCSSRPLRVN